MAAMSPGSDSYEELFGTIRRLHLPYKASEQIFLQMVFNVISRNVDDHSKNFAFCMTSNGVWKLSPAYDVTFSVDLSAPAYLNRHSLSINGKNDEITHSDIETVASQNDIRDYQALINKVVESVRKFENYAHELGIDKRLTQRIRSAFRWPNR
jgi:serine/threonine-protein kinase HipA